MLCHLGGSPSYMLDLAEHAELISMGHACYNRRSRTLTEFSRWPFHYIRVVFQQSL